jgi:hypothetical protein
VHEPSEDQARFDRLAEAHLVRQQPTHRIHPRRALGDIQLVWKQSHPTAKKGAESVSFTLGQQMEHFEPQQKVLRVVCIAARESREQLAFVAHRPRQVFRLDAFERLRRGRQAQPLAGWKLDDDRAPLDGRYTADAELRVVAVREVIPSFPGSRQWAVSRPSIVWQRAS